MLEARDLEVGLAGRPLLRGVDLRVAPGERVGVLGPSGSGKTTLLRVLAGLIDPLDGEVRFEGRTGDAVGWPRWRRRVTYVAQQPVVTPGTVRANLERPLRYGRARRGGLDEERAAARLRELGLSGVLDQEARTLSVGQKQRVALVRALAIEPAVLLLDEPTGALDAEAAAAVEALVARYTEEGGAALVVTHDAAQARRWCTREVDLRSYRVEAARG
ncbi:MAG: ABC transporter ATP-binding protein [Myxococcota bacterium]